MIANDSLIVLLKPSCSVEDDLSKLKYDSILRQYFGYISQLTSAKGVLNQTRSINGNNITIVVVERGFFSKKRERDAFKKKLKNHTKHILFGEDYPSGNHHMVLAISSLYE